MLRMYKTVISLFSLDVILQLLVQCEKPALVLGKAACWRPYTQPLREQTGAQGCLCAQRALPQGLPGVVQFSPTSCHVLSKRLQASLQRVSAVSRDEFRPKLHRILFTCQLLGPPREACLRITVSLGLLKVLFTAESLNHSSQLTTGQKRISVHVTFRSPHNKYYWPTE